MRGIFVQWFFKLWTLAQITVIACIPLHLQTEELGVAACTDVDTGQVK